MKKKGIQGLDPRKNIIIKGARVHNLKNIDVVIPRNKMVVITGLSGSGKSSLAFDTLYADGQRRYVESLSSYARQFLGRMDKPDVDSIQGIAPAIAIEQKVNTRNPRSTVGTTTEIYEYLKLLFARIGTTYSPVSGKDVKRHTVSDVVRDIKALPDGSRLLILAPITRKEDRKFSEHLNVLLQQGFSRILMGEEVMRIEDVMETAGRSYPKDACIVVDRIQVKHEENGIDGRIGDSVQTAWYEANGTCFLDVFKGEEKERLVYSNRFEQDGIEFEEPSVNLFSFNNPYGACKTCEGFGSVIGIDEDLVVPDKRLSVYEDAVACWRGEKMGEWKERLLDHAHKFDFHVHTPYFKLTDEERQLLWKGNQWFGGIDEFFKHVETQTYKIQYRVMLSRYRGKTVCPDCRGSRLRKDASWVKINGRSITDVVLMPVSRALEFFRNIELNEYDRDVAKRLLTEICNRLAVLEDVGLGYLSLNRLTNTLSGGESQRINLATSIGSSLVGSMYILDEPSIGLHPRDTHRLVKVLQNLQKLGNTVIVVEHEEEVILAADTIIDIGPEAGVFGGEVVFTGSYNEIVEKSTSLTGQYLGGKKNIALPAFRRPWDEYIMVEGASENNLKNIDVKFPLHIMTVVTGVSGSGKSSLVRDILYSALKKTMGGYGEKTGRFTRLSGDLKRIGQVEMVDQNPIGKSSRSNPATYIKAYDDIRALFASQQLSKLRGYKPGFFSFNIDGGRCDECQGEGIVRIEMQFMADIELVCDSCEGKRFKDEVLEVKYKDKNIADVLEMSINEAIDFFQYGVKGNNLESRILSKLLSLQQVGLGYLKLGQPSSTLSGGEAQRIKLAFFLTKGNAEQPALFIFDEPTTGLHFHDINKLLVSLNALIANGHSVLIIEHNLEVIKCADWIIELGPEGGEEGGQLVFEGKAEDLAEERSSYTASFLKAKLNL